jgi:hypothetical protein
MNTNHNPAFSAPRAALRLASGLGLLSLAGAFAPSLSAALPLAQISVHIGIDAPPPPPRAEVVVERNRPGPDYVWIGGYWDGSPGHYSWVNGRWDHPPHAHATWFAPHWERDHDGHYHQVRGEWRDEVRH